MLSNNNDGFTMPVVPMYGNGGGGMGGFGNDGAWWLLILLFALGGWGNRGGNGFGGGGGNDLYPWMNQANLTSDGFQNQLMNDNITSIRDGVHNLSTQLCNCCADMAQTVNSGFANAETAANARQIANMQTAFAAQTAMAQGFNQISSQFADCCCENRLANCQTQNIIQSEASATRFADANNTRDIIQSQTNGIQTVLDKLCQLELDAKNDKIADLERQLTMANLSASQIAQTAQIRAGQVEEIDAMYNRLRDCPVPTMPVYGSQPIFTCPNNNNGCGCGCGGNF